MFIISRWLLILFLCLFVPNLFAEPAPHQPFKDLQAMEEHSHRVIPAFLHSLEGLKKEVFDMYCFGYEENVEKAKKMY